MNNIIKNIFLIIHFLISINLTGQEVISLEKAIEIAEINNSKLRSDAMMIQFHQASVNTAYQFAPTQVDAELGQFNSTYFDTGFGVSQTFSLPQVYKSRAALNKQRVRTAEYLLNLSESEIRMQLDLIFMEYGYLSSMEFILQKQDSVYAAFVDRAHKRVQNGETDVLEKATADQQKLNISKQLAMVSKNKDYLIVEIEWLLNDGKKYIPVTNDFEVLKYGIFYDSLSILHHPAMMVAEQEISVARQQTVAERTALLPEFSAGYRNVSIRGTGADNVTYQGKDRFSSFQIGVGIPIFRKGIQASIQAATVMEQVKVQDYISKRIELESKIKQKYIIYNETVNQLTQYEQKALPNALLIRSVTEKQLENGQINYLEYVLLTNQAVNIETEYIELKRNLNAIIIDLHYLTTNY